MLFSFPLIARQVYPKGIDKAITNTTKKPETNEANVTVPGKANPPGLPGFAGRSGGWIAVLLRPQKAVFASLVRKIFETGGRFEKSNFFFFYQP